MKLWIFLLIIASFVFWFILGKIWETPKEENSYSNKDQYYVFPTPKTVTTDPFSTQGRPTLVVTPAESSAAAGVIRF